MLSKGMSPLLVHKKIVLSTEEPISQKNVPTRGQLRQMKYQLKMKNLPSTDALKNIIIMHSDNFLVKLRLAPSILITLCAPAGSELIIKHGQTIYIDGTFDLVESNLILTTVMIDYKDLGVPVAWCLSNSKTTDIYASFLQHLRKQSKFQWNPHNILSDFEDAIRRACVLRFPRANILGDSFHVIQDNIKWLRSHNGSDLIPELIIRLRSLIASRTLQEYSANERDYLTFWEQKQRSDYVNYFRNVWKQKYPPDCWARYGRIFSDAPSGDQILEGYHNRLQNIISEKKHETIDHFVNLLWSEWCYYYKIISNPILYWKNKFVLREDNYDVLSLV
jgi:hypothetical protein